MKKNNKITFVTAFFPLNREEFKGFERSNQKYYDSFEFWARIHNDLIIYTDKYSRDIVENIRVKKFRRTNTKIIIIDDYTKIDEELYFSIRSTTENELNIKYHLFDKNPESWNANYNYIMSLKGWFVTNAIKEYNLTDTIAWIDFGFNHGGEYYTNSEDFDFEWTYKFPDKVNFFCVNQPDNIPIFESIKLMSSYISGGMIVAPIDLWEEFWQYLRNTIIKLNYIGLMDDDQIFYYLFYKENPDKCALHKSGWFDEFEKFSDQKFNIINKTNRKKSLLHIMKDKIRWRITIIKYLHRWYKIMKDEKSKG